MQTVSLWLPDLGISDVEIWIQNTTETDIKTWYTLTGKKDMPPTALSSWSVLRQALAGDKEPLCAPKPFALPPREETSSLLS